MGKRCHFCKNGIVHDPRKLTFYAHTDTGEAECPDGQNVATPERTDAENTSRTIML